MTDKTVPEDELRSFEEEPPYPTASPEEMPTRGGKLENLVGRWPGDIFDGFEEEINWLRGRPTRPKMPMRARTRMPDPQYPTATPEEMPKGGGNIEDFVGRWPGDIDDGFEEEVNRMRGHHRRDWPSW